MLTRVSLVIVFVLIPIAAVQSGETVRDESLGFTLVLPDGFLRLPVERMVEAKTEEPKTVHGFFLPDAETGHANVLVLIKWLPGILPQEPIDPRQLPAGLKGRLFKTRWQGFDLDAFEIPGERNGVEWISLNVQVPLKQKAIQIDVAGPITSKDELRSHLASILQGLHGETNWTHSNPSAATTSDQNPDAPLGAALWAVPAGIVLVGCVVLWLISRHSRQGTVLVLAVLIWLCGSVVGGHMTRMSQLVAGGLKMLGFAGGILGISDLVAKKKSDPSKTDQRTGQDGPA